MTHPALVAVVDDDEDVRESLEMLILSIGLRAVLFASGDALLASPDLDHVQCIISDVQMPGINGVQLAREILKVRSLPIILITAFPAEEIERQAKEAGVQAFLSKPFDPNVLIEELEKLPG